MAAASAPSMAAASAPSMAAASSPSMAAASCPFIEGQEAAAIEGQEAAAIEGKEAAVIEGQEAAAIEGQEAAGNQINLVEHVEGPKWEGRGHRNRVTGPTPKEIGNIITLKSLVLEFNQLSRTLALQLGVMASIARLRISDLNGSEATFLPLVNMKK
ncbi:hypothetical protein FNV43_RR16274 [Rhamnella rubrinervis]|uniref:Uncharacterized protein n=1 Tax=Rhamnella rubrinervis TaxID=2594499 RepID=A0A8K0E878_9ROSA|nr:hypothetical protein FNV43_RR16274 [Rhamnella rubrinervis]